MPQTLAPPEPRRSPLVTPPPPRGVTAASQEALPAPRRRLPFIDGLRGLAMLMVLGFHCWLGCGAGIPIAMGRWHLDAAGLLQLGYLGVHLFLVLSGFCLTYPLARGGARAMRLDLRRFAQRRAWRILPPYYVALAIFSLRPVLERALRTALGHPDRSIKPYTTGMILSHVFMVHNLSLRWVRTINGSFWSLALEWQLYMIFPLLIWSFRRWGLARTVGAVLGVNLAYRSWVYAAHAGVGSMPYTPPHAVGCLFAYAALPGRVFEFVLGMVAALLLADERGLPARAWTRGYLAASALLAILGFAVTQAWSPFSPVTDLIWGLAFFCLVMYAAGRSALGGGWLDSRPLVGLGTISYSVYLIHEPLLRRAEELMGPFRFSPIVTLLLLGFVIAPLTIGCGWLYFRVVESRFVRPGPRAA